MPRILLTLICAVAVFASPALAQDEGECLLPQSDYTVVLSPDVSAVWRVSGGAQVNDVTLKPSNLPATTVTETPVHLTPEADADSIAVIPASRKVEIYGRSADNRWLYAVAPPNPSHVSAGWLAADSVSVIGLAMMLPVISVDNPPQIQPLFQSVYIPSETCTHSEIAGALVQSRGAGFAAVTVNGVDVLIEGTAFVRPTEDALTVNVISGRAIVNHETLVPEGTAAVVYADGRAERVPYDVQVMVSLPRGMALDSDFEAVGVADARAAEAIASAAESMFADAKLLDGAYRLMPSDDACEIEGMPPVIFLTDGETDALDAALDVLSPAAFTIALADDACTAVYHGLWRSYE